MRMLLKFCLKSTKKIKQFDMLLPKRKELNHPLKNYINFKIYLEMYFMYRLEKKVDLWFMIQKYIVL